MPHSLSSVVGLRTAIESSGGAWLLTGSRPPYYVGLHRPPAATALEAALVWLADPSFEEIRVFTGDCSPESLPKWTLHPDTPNGNDSLGYQPAVWWYRGGPALPDKEEVSLNDPDPNEFALPDFGEVLKPPAGGFPTEDHARISSLPKRIEYLCDQVQVGAQKQGRRLFLVDANYLNASDLANQEDNFSRERGPRAKRCADQFARLPKLCAGTGLSLIILFPDPSGAQSFSRGTFHRIRVHNPSSQDLSFRPPPEPFPNLRWEKIPTLTLPAEDCPPSDNFVSRNQLLWKNMDPHSSSNQPMYNMLRSFGLSESPSPLVELKQMPGMDKLVLFVESVIARHRRTQYEEKHGTKLDRGDIGNHIKITGSPGTGKTTAARAIGRALAEAGVFKSVKFTEGTATDLVGEFVGSSGPKTRALFERARGGVLFIDEAYGICHKDEFGKEVVDEMLKLLDDSPDPLVILAGYKDKFKDLEKINAGLLRRFSQAFDLEDYDDAKLVNIACLKQGKICYPFKDEDREAILQVIRQKIVAAREWCGRDDGPQFDNAGFIKNLLASAQGNRDRELFGDPDHQPSAEDMVLTLDNFKKATTPNLPA